MLASRSRLKHHDIKLLVSWTGPRRRFLWRRLRMLMAKIMPLAKLLATGKQTVYKLQTPIANFYTHLDTRIRTSVDA